MKKEKGKRGGMIKGENLSNYEGTGNWELSFMYKYEHELIKDQGLTDIRIHG